MTCCLLLVPCALLSIVCPLPSCHLIIVSVAPPMSPSLPSFVFLFSPQVSVVLCWSIVFRCVCEMLTVQQFFACLPACLFFPFQVVFVALCFILLLKETFPCVWVLAFIYIYIYAFNRRFYPMRLTVHSGYTCFLSVCVPWELNAQPLHC